MSRRLVRFFTCDKPRCCARLVHGTGIRLTPLTVLRHTARAAGWAEETGRDYCPNHQAWPGIAAWAMGGAVDA
ncbi:hypothetical protein ACFCYB_00485 [Streptomyces sp. NPDC056309]|uniref:hypothetical protein n=1 Tax=Streptomyces sp. NPDC056309 TaxID=3345781 RepID=UPI0035D534F2